MVINTYRTGEDPSRVFIPSAGWCDLGEELAHDSAVRTLTAEDVEKYVPSEEIRAWVQGRDAICRWPVEVARWSGCSGGR